MADSTDIRENQDRKFQVAVSGLNTRENSTLGVATTAASASLVLFGLENLSPLQQGIISWAGLVFSILGIGYRELTILTIDTIQLRDLRKFLGRKEPIWPNKWFWIFGQARRLMVRMLLFTPSLLWLSKMSDYNRDQLWVTVSFIGELAVLFTVLEIVIKDDTSTRVSRMN